MSKPLEHAKNSVKKYGGEISDYMPIHELLDSSKAAICNSKHRALTHNSWFISVIIPRIFGEVFKRKSDGVEISSRDIAEDHVIEDYNGFVPTPQDFLDNMETKPWMNNGEGKPPSSGESKGVEVTGPIIFDGVKKQDPFDLPNPWFPDPPPLDYPWTEPYVRD